MTSGSIQVLMICLFASSKPLTSKFNTRQIFLKSLELLRRYFFLKITQSDDIITKENSNKKIQSIIILKNLFSIINTLLKLSIQNTNKLNLIR